MRLPVSYSTKSRIVNCYANKLRSYTWDLKAKRPGRERNIVMGHASNNMGCPS